MKTRRTNRYAFFEGKLVPIEEAKVGVMCSAFNYGTAVFEGIRAHWSEEDRELYAFRLEEHFARFLQNARLLLMDLPHTAEELSAITLDLLRRERFQTDVYVRPLAYKSSEIVGVRLHDLDARCAMIAVPFGPYLDKPDGARVCVSSWRRVSDNAIPARGKITGAYVNSALAKTEAHQNGFDDAILLGADGHVSEATAANLFLVRDGTLLTPPVTEDILEGITRATVIELAEREGIPVHERPVDRSELYVASEIFLCGTAVGVVPVSEVDRRRIGAGSPGPVTVRLRSLYETAARGRDPRYNRWCTPVYGGKAPPSA